MLLLAAALLTSLTWLRLASGEAGGGGFVFGVFFPVFGLFCGLSCGGGSNETTP